MKHIEFDQLRLDRRDDPSGVAIAWALLAVCVALVAGIRLTVAWVVSL